MARAERVAGQSVLYRRTLGSRRWQLLRRQVLERCRGRCERCRRRPVDEVHHLTYVRLGREWLGDLEGLCKPCHARADAERAAVTAQRQQDARWAARLDAWAGKRYGSDWAERRPAAVVEAEFAAWVRQREGR